MGSMSLIHWVIVLAVAALLFGGSRLASVGKGLGEGIKNFKKGLADSDDGGQASRESKELEEKSTKRQAPPEA